MHIFKSKWKAVIVASALFPALLCSPASEQGWSLPPLFARLPVNWCLAGFGQWEVQETGAVRKAEVNISPLPVCPGKCLSKDSYLFLCSILLHGSSSG